MQETIVIFESDEQLRAVLSVGLWLPKLRIWVKMDKTVYEGLCPAALGDETKTIKEQFYGNEIAETTDVYVILGRDDTTDNDEPTGNFRTLDQETIDNWIAEFGVESMYLDYPRQEI